MFWVQHLLLHRSSTDLDPDVGLGALFSEEVNAGCAGSVLEELFLPLKNVGLGLCLDVRELVGIESAEFADWVLRG